MSKFSTCLFLLPAALLAASCEDSGEFAALSSPALTRSAVGGGATEAFAGEIYRDVYLQVVSPGLYLPPSEVNEITSIYYSCYPVADIGAENWYDKNKLHHENSDFLENLRKTDTARLTRILRAYENLASKGDVHAMINAGCFYYNGYGTAKDFAKAMKFFREAAQCNTDKASTALYNIRFLQIENKEFLLEDCLRELDQSAKNATRSLEYGEQIYLLGKHKAKTDAEKRMVRELLERLIPQDKGGFCLYVSALCHRHGLMGVPTNESQALQLCHKAAQASLHRGGCSYAKLTLGHAYLFGQLGQTPDRQKAMEFYMRAASTSPDLGITNVAHRARTALAVDSLLRGEANKKFSISYTHGTDIKDTLTPLSALREANKAGDGTAAYNLGIYLLQKAGGAMKPEILSQIAGGADCGQQNIEALVRIYSSIHRPGTPPTATAADIDQLRQLDSPAAKTLLANCHATGTGVPRDMKEAVRLYAENADQCPEARLNLALCYEKGAGLAPNAAKAAALRAQTPGK